MIAFSHNFSNPSEIEQRIWLAWEREAALLRRWPQLARVGPQPCNQLVGQTLIDHLRKRFGVLPNGAQPQELD
jgi:hypothetical protein